MLYRALQAGRQFVPPAFRKLVPPRCNTPPSSFDLSILSLSHSPLRSLPLPFSSPSPRTITDLFLSFSSPLPIWLSCEACTISISCGYPVADSRHESRHHPAGVRRGNAKRQTGSPSPASRSSLFFCICLSDRSPPLSFSVSPSVFLSLLLCIYLYLVLSYHLPPTATTFSPPHSLFLSCDRSLDPPRCPAYSRVHRKVVVPGMRLIPREYQEPSKRTEVG